RDPHSRPARRFGGRRSSWSRSGSSSDRSLVMLCRLKRLISPKLGRPSVGTVGAHERRAASAPHGSLAPTTSPSGSGSGALSPRRFAMTPHRTFLAPGQRYAEIVADPRAVNHQLTILQIAAPPDGAAIVTYRR